MDFRRLLAASELRDELEQRAPELAAAAPQSGLEGLEGGISAGWILLPLRGRKRYKKCSRVFKVKVTPQMAEEIEGAGAGDFILWQKTYVNRKL